MGAIPQTPVDDSLAKPNTIHLPVLMAVTSGGDFCFSDRRTRRSPRQRTFQRNQASCEGLGAPAAMRLTADLIARSPAFINTVKDRELDLRGAPCAAAACAGPDLWLQRGCAPRALAPAHSPWSAPSTTVRASAVFAHAVSDPDGACAPACQATRSL